MKLFKNLFTAKTLSSIICLFLFILTIVLLSSLTHNTAQAIVGPPYIEIPIDYFNVQLYGITSGSDGNIWFSVHNGNYVGTVNVTSGVISKYPLCTETISQQCDPAGITTGPDGDIWVVDNVLTFISNFQSDDTPYLKQITTNGTIANTFPLPTNWIPDKITEGPDGNLWLSVGASDLDSSASAIERVTPSGNATVFPLPNGEEADTIITGSDGNLWFTDPKTLSIGRMSLTGSVTEFYVDQNPIDIAKGPDGNLWFTEGGGQSDIGRITPSGVFTQFPITSPKQGWNIITGPDGNIWITGFEGGFSNSFIGYLTPTGTFTDFIDAPNFGDDFVSSGMTVGSDGNIWTLDPNQGNIILVNLAGTAITPYPTPTPLPPTPTSPPPPPPPTSEGPIYPVMNTDETPPDGIWFRNSPHTADTNRITGDGIYAGDRVQLICYAYGDAVGPYNDSLWYYVTNVTRPTVLGTGAPNVGYLNAHYINDGKVANQVDAGVPACGNVPSYTPPAQAVQESHSTSSSSTNTVNNGEPINMIGGNYLATRKEFTVPGHDLPVDFYLSYNSENASQSGVLGYGWTHSYLMSVTPEASGDAIIQNEDGRMDLYTPNGSGRFTPPPDIHDSLISTTNGYKLTRKNHIVYNFNTSGQLITIVSPNGNTQTLSYNTQNELTTLTDTVGRTFTFSYDTNNHLTQVTDPSGRTVKYTYDVNGNLETATDPEGNVTTYQYDANHEITGIIDPRGNTAVTNTYDTNGQVITQTNALGKIISLAYSPEQTVFTDQKGNKTTYFYDNQLRITKIQDANGGVTTYMYDSNDNQNSITDPNGNKTSMLYDNNGNLTQLTNANGNITKYIYDSNSNLISQTDPLGHITNFAYDGHDNLTQKIDSNGNKIIYSYDTYGDLVKITDPMNNTTAFSYDNQGDISSITDPLGNISTISYDTIGRPVSSTDASGHTSQYAYDALDRLIQTKDALGDTTTYVFDPDGNQTKVTDPNNHATSYVYNTANELTSVTDALGHTTSYSYDPDGNLITTTDPNNHTTRYAYDVLNRLVSTTNPIGQKTIRSYDANGNLISSTDSKGQTTTYAYNPINQLTTITYQDSSKVSYAYDADGNRTQMTDATGTTVYAYDVLGNLTQVTSPGNKTISYTYDKNANQTSLTYPDGHKETYGYNKANQLISTQDWNNHTTTYQYNPTGTIKQTTYPNGADITYTYDIANQVTAVTNTPKLGTGTTYAYTLDPNGNRTSVDQTSNVSEINTSIIQTILKSFPNLGNLYQNITKNNELSFSDPATTTFYTYDAANRLLTVKGLNKNQTYTYDPVGNRLTLTTSNKTTTYSYNQADELIKAGNIAYSYDPNGNRIQEDSNGNITTYAYNEANELTTISNGNQVADKYIYDGDGNRVQTTANTITTNDIWNVNNTTPQLLSQTMLNKTTDYQYGLNLISNDSQSNSQNYYEYDGLGSVTGLTDAQGMQTNQYSYDAYGNPLGEAKTIGQPFQNPFGYAGQQQDPTGLSYMHARYYDPTTGTFTSHDTYPANLNNPQTINRYTYVQDNPINYIDPTGLSSCEAGQTTNQSTNITFILTSYNSNSNSPDSESYYENEINGYVNDYEDDNQDVMNYTENTAQNTYTDYSQGDTPAPKSIFDDITGLFKTADEIKNNAIKFLF